MSWLYSQALVEAFSEATSSDGAPSAPSNGNPTQQAYCAPDKMTAFSRLSRFGMTYAPLTADRGEELLTLYLAVFRAKTSVQQEKEPESPEVGQGSGEKWRGSFTRYDPDSALWRTHQCSLAGDLEPFSETWPQWGLMRGGECWEQQTLAHHISGTESGLWPTPTVCGNYNRKGASPTSGDGLATAVNKWPTPLANDHKNRRPTENWTGTDLPSVVWTKTGGAENPQMSPAQLSATWVEWLMGWPLGWTDLKPLEMDKSHCVLQPHGNYLQEE